MKKIVVIQAMAVAGLLFLASCADSSAPLTNANSLGDEVRAVASVRNPHDILALIETYTDITIQNQQFRDNHDLVRNSLSWGGGASSSSLKAAKELFAKGCELASTDTNKRPKVFGTFNFALTPFNGVTPRHDADARRALVTHLLTRATGDMPAKEDIEIAKESFDRLMTLVPNTTAGTQVAVRVICTAIGASALAGIAF